MSRKSNLQRFQTITNGDLSQATVTSQVTDIRFLDNVGFQFNWTGSTPIGTIAIEISIDHAQDELGNVTNEGNWVPVPITPTPSVSGNTGSLYLDLNQLSAPWIRAKYTKTSGTGTIQAYIAGKML